MDAFFQAFALFIPILAANQAAHVVKDLRWPDRPTFPPVFGKNKTLMPFLVAPTLAMIPFLLFNLVKEDLNWVVEGVYIGLGVVIAEHAKSAFKRLLGLKEGTPFFLDRIDFAVGGGIGALLCIPWVTWVHVLWLVAIAYPVHYFGNKFSHSQGWRDTPH